MRRLAWMLALAALVACEKKEAPEGAMPVGTDAALTAAEDAPIPDDIPTPADFEATEAARIEPVDLQAELDDLEKEIEDAGD